MQEKRVFWQYEIEGERDIKTEVEKLILETADEYKRQADVTNKAVRTVIIESINKYYIFGEKVPLDSTRMMKIFFILGTKLH